MKIEFTEKEYRSLLEAMQIADWVLHAHDTEPRTDTGQFNGLFQKLLALANEMGCAELVEFEMDNNQYQPTLALETAVEDYIEEFESNTFWEELVARLAERDVLKQANVTDLANIGTKARISLFSDAEEKWNDEMSTFGLDRVCVDETLDKITH